MLTRRRFLARSAASVLAAAGCPILSASFAERVGGHVQPIIDSHVHVFERSPRFPFAPGAHPPVEDAPPEKLIALMRTNGVARTVIIQVIHYEWDNSYLLSALKRYPTLFQGVCRVNPEDPAAPDELAERVVDLLAARGMIGSDNQPPEHLSRRHPVTLRKPRQCRLCAVAYPQVQAGADLVAVLGARPVSCLALRAGLGFRLVRCFHGLD